eukprot:285788-Pyramimonas_sp.AAC.1
MKDILDDNVQDIFVEDDGLFGLCEAQELGAEDKAELEERWRLLAEDLTSVTANLFSSVREKA